MPKTENIHTTAGGWTISDGETIAATAAWHIKLAYGDEAEVAASEKISVAELRCRLEDHNYPPEPVISPEVAAILKKQMPDMDKEIGITGEATEGDLLRICALAIRLCRDYIAVDYVKGCTIYEPPALFEKRRLQLHDALYLAMDAAAAIPATTWMGVCAKARVASEYGTDADSSDVTTPIIVSLLEDVGTLDRPDGASPGICMPGVWTPRPKPAFFIETNNNLDQIWASAQA